MFKTLHPVMSANRHLSEDHSKLLPVWVILNSLNLIPCRKTYKKIFSRRSCPKQKDISDHLTLSLLGGQSKETLKTTIEVATFELCNFSTIHSHGSNVGSFESQETGLSF